MRRALATTLAVASAALGVGGCHSNDPVYFPGVMLLQSDGLEVKDTLSLRFRTPTASEASARNDLSAKLGYEVPWLREDRVHVEIRYTIKNLDTDPAADGAIWSLAVDGATEYTRFDLDAIAAAFEAANEDAPSLGRGLLQVENPPTLKAGEVYQGIIREDDFHEAAIDLDAMGRFMAPFAAVIINRSEVNPIGLDLTPSAPASDMKPAAPVQWILPALWEITPRFRADRPMSCQFLVRVRDDENRLWENGNDEFLPEPVTFMPMVMP